MSIVTGKEITLEQSVTESNPKKYQGYVKGCNDAKFNDGTWSPNTSITGIGISVSDSVISVWNTNSTTKDVSREFEWTSSKLSGCTKKFTVVAKGIEIVVSLESGNTELLITAEYDGVSSNLINIQGAIDQILINGSSNGITVTKSSLSLNPITSCNGGISQYWINYGESLGGSYSSGYIYISLNPDMGSDLIGCTSNYTVSTGGLTLNINYNGKSITKIIPVKCNINYIKTEADYCPTATIKLYGDNNFTTEVSEGTGGAVNIRISVTDWKDIPKSNRKKFGSYSDGGNNITISKPNNYTEGYASWSGNNYDILGGIGGADGEYSFSITICGQTYTKKYTKKTSTVTYICPEASFNVTETKCDIYSTTTVYINVTNWGSVTSGNYNSWGSRSGNNLEIIADTDKNKNYSYEIGDYESRFKQFSVIIRHEKAYPCSDNSLDDGLKLHLKCVSSNTILSSITISPNYGNFVTTFNRVLSSGNAIEIYIKNGNCTHKIAVMDAFHSSTTQYIPIWRSALDMPCNNCDNSCTEVSFTIGWRIRGTVNLRSIKANGKILTGSESNTFTLNPCTSSNFNISVDLN